MRYVVTGGAGFIGSHLVDFLIDQDQEVTVFDNLLSGYLENLSPRAEFIRGDINSTGHLAAVCAGAAGVFHLAAIARTPWCMEDPMLAGRTNSQGTLSVLEACRQVRVPRVVLASSNVVYAANTPYRASKEMVEIWTRCYVETYGQSALALRFSNVYGPRQSEEGPSPNVFAAFRKSLREKGYITVTGDGEQSRNFTHVTDIARGLWLAMQNTYSGEAIDLCTNQHWSMNAVCRLWLKLYNTRVDRQQGQKSWEDFVKYIPERPGDVKHIIQKPHDAFLKLGWTAKVGLADGLKDVL